MQQRTSVQDDRRMQAVDNHRTGLPGRLGSLQGWGNRKTNDGPENKYRYRPRRDRRLRARTIVFPISFPRPRFHLSCILAHDAFGDAIILTNGPQRVISGQNAIQTGAIPLPSAHKN
jgi:hypothetical protein